MCWTTLNLLEHLSTHLGTMHVHVKQLSDHFKFVGTDM